jgi:Tfp pilus assembly protein PilF
VLSLHYLGVCLYGKGDKVRAEQSFKSAINVDPTFAAAHFSLGELYEGDGKLEEAKKAYQAASALDHTEARDALKRLAAAPK